MVRFFGEAEKRTTFPSLARAERARDAKNAFRLCPPLNYYILDYYSVIAVFLKNVK
ncbi:MAG: hypothetical protein U5L45_18195 [Saprospiraceae bacterium]|nr:hypothetical protein [Saprospiraceae bacterium]